MARLLVVDDDPTVAEVVGGYLARAGHDVRRADDGPSALRAVDQAPPDLIVLDLMLPGIDGLEVCRRVRAEHPSVLVIMLTALAEEEDRIAGLQVGADDYVTKPFSPRELVLRVESVLRRGSMGTTDGSIGRADRELLRSGDLVVDPAARRVTRGGTDLNLTVRELDLLIYLMTHPGVAFSRADLMASVWGWTFGDQSTVTVHVRRLREKIEADPSDPRIIQTVWGVGYRLELEPVISTGSTAPAGSAP